MNDLVTNQVDNLHEGQAASDFTEVMRLWVLWCFFGSLDFDFPPGEGCFVWLKQKPSGKIIGLSWDDHWHSNRRVDYFFQVKFVEILLKINWNLSHFDT